MGRYVTQQWTPRATDGVPRRFTRSGTYQAFVPDSLLDLDVRLDPDVSRLLDEAESRARVGGRARGARRPRTGRRPARPVRGGGVLPHRGVRADTPRGGGRRLRRARPRVGRDRRPQPARRPGVGGARPRPARVARVGRRRAAAPDRASACGRPHRAGRGSAVGPRSRRTTTPRRTTWCPGLLDDLDRYVESRRHGPVLAAALAHAQLETIHPFADGNGRAGRVLIGTVLARYGVAPRITLPVSTALFRDRERYYSRARRLPPGRPGRRDRDRGRRGGPRRCSRRARPVRSGDALAAAPDRRPRHLPAGPVADRPGPARSRPPAGRRPARAPGARRRHRGGPVRGHRRRRAQRARLPGRRPECCVPTARRTAPGPSTSPPSCSTSSRSRARRRTPNHRPACRSRSRPRSWRPRRRAAPGSPVPVARVGSRAATGASTDEPDRDRTPCKGLSRIEPATAW